ncbi:uncharacterized protein LOC111445570 isoform X2 [Cucurbita moschata]|uniref:Uncharacterized protein LOC111445570 isoform X2 n=1 Tax=Cucurbita moschata TaxID=3662 RepID=A0A6J1FGW1_CUCMO|nr:uncharacterized protein LOC111445570 isoform X2 [Cucurbita moschata]
MEEYLQYMKTLRLQMSDVEDQVSKISVEEHMHFTTIRTMENDLTAAKSELKQFKEDAERMMRAKGEICSQILEQQRKITSLEHDICTLSQTLELIQQEKVSLGAKIIEKSNYYAKVSEDISLKFQDQQDWVNANMIRGEAEEHGLVKFETAKRGSETEGSYDTVGGISGTRIYCSPNNLVLNSCHGLASVLKHNVLSNVGLQVEERKDLESAKDKLSQVSKMKCAVVLENSKPELRAMDDVTLEEESKALLSDKAGETEYSRSLQDQIAKLKEISRVIKCTCGKEYKAGISSST